jgi:hypothetical protein
LDVSQTTADSIWSNNRKILAASNVFNTDGGAGGNFTQQVNKSIITVAASTTLTTASLTCEYASANGVAFFLLPAAATSADKIFQIKKIDATAQNVWISPAGTDTFEGSSSWLSLTTQYQWVTLQSDGTSSWKIIGRTVPSTGVAPGGDTYTLVSADVSGLPNSRTLAAGKNMFFTDGGAGSTFTEEVGPVTSITSGTTNLTATSNTVIICDASGGAITINLPAASNSNKLFRIKKVDSSANTVTISRAGSDLIDGATTYVLTIQYQAADVVAGTTANQWNLL